MIHINNIWHGYQIAETIPRVFNPAADKVISRVDAEDRLLGGVIYEGMISNCIFMHQGSFDKKWLSQDMLWICFDYPFHQLGVGKVCGTIPSSNTELLDFNRRLGFKVECSIKDAYTDGDLVIMSMTREECRWLKIKPKTIRRGGTVQ